MDEERAEIVKTPGAECADIPAVQGWAFAPHREAMLPRVAAAQSDGTLRLVWRWRRLVLMAALCGIGAGLAATLIQEPLYRARARLEVQALNENFLNVRDVMPLNENGASPLLSDMQTQIQFLQSDRLLNVVDGGLAAQATELERDNTALAPIRAKLQRWRVLPVVTAKQEIGRVRNSLKARGVGQTRIIEITAESANPYFAANYLNRVSEAFINQSTDDRLKVSQATGEWLDRLVRSIEQKLRSSEAALHAYARQRGLLFTSEKKMAEDEKLKQLQEELSRATSARIAKQSRYEVASASLPEVIPDSSNDSSLREYHTRLTELRRQRADLAVTYTPDQAKVKRLDAQIAVMEAALARERQNIVEKIRNEYKEASEREAQLLKSYGQQAHVVSGLSEVAIQYNMLQRAVESNRQSYDAMLQRARQATIASAMNASNIRVVDSATPPRFPYRPSLLFNCGIGLFAFSFGAILLAYYRESTDTTLKELGDAPTHLCAPELGVVLHARNSDELLNSPKPRFWAKADLAGVSRPSSCPQWSPVLESLRGVATSILFSGPPSEMPRIIAVTSSAAREGKTTIVANLGLVLARAGHRVLIIDGDLYRSRLHHMFALSNDSGLAGLLRENASSKDQIQGSVRATFVPGLYVLTSGINNASEYLLRQSSIAELLELARQQFDVVLIDTAPVLLTSAARVISRAADAVLLVARAGQTTRAAANAAVYRLELDGAKLLGVVLNDWNVSRSRSGYYGYYRSDHFCNPNGRDRS